MEHPILQLKIVEWHNDTVILLDQRQLPRLQTYLELTTWQDVCTAIHNLSVRGAPAIGIAGAFALTLSAVTSKGTTSSEILSELETIAPQIIATRPTAVNLYWGVQKVLQKARELAQLAKNDFLQKLRDYALFLKNDDIATNQRLGFFGQELIQDNDVVLTHCNAGALATAGFGTALGVLYASQIKGKKFSVYADETRPVLQGARLTAWELCFAGIPTTLICDNMSASLMAQKKITKIIVGADRIARNGDTANKIGTYNLAVLAHYHKIPFYIAAPFSTIDSQTATGQDIVIEERQRQEVTHVGQSVLAPDDVHVYNPAFDVTPAHLITGIITDKGIYEYPYTFQD